MTHGPAICLNMLQNHEMVDEKRASILSGKLLTILYGLFELNYKHISKSLMSLILFVKMMQVA